MNNSGKGSLIGFFAPLLLFVIFTVLSFAVILLATRVYRNTVENSALRQNASTALSYIAQKIHASDSTGAVSVEELDGICALTLRENTDNEDTVTYIYFDNGALRELYVTADIQPMKEFGEPLLEISALRIEALSDRLISVTCADLDGREEERLFTLKSE